MSKVSINYGSGTIIFTALLCLCKVAGILNISWWWCFCLLWIPLAIMLGICLLVVLFAVVAGLIIIIKNLIK